MDSFFGIGLPELILILVIAGVVMGPERIGRTARWLGRTSTQLQNISRSFVRQLNAEIDAAGDSDELKSAWQDMQDLRRQLDELKGELTSVTGAALNEGKKSIADTENELKRSIAPPKFRSLGERDIKPPESENGTAAQALPKRVDVVDDPEL